MNKLIGWKIFEHLMVPFVCEYLIVRTITNVTIMSDWLNCS